MVSKIRVVHLITQLELGGAQRNTLYTVNHLNPDRFETTLLCGPGGILDAEASASSASVVFIPSLIRSVRPWLDVMAFIRIYLALRRLRPHVVHTHSSKAGILGRLAAYLAGVPVIIHTFHGFGFTPRQRSWVRWLFIKVEWLTARLSSHLVFVSDANRQEARDLGITGSKPTSLIRSGITMKTTAPAPIRRELGIEPDAWIVVSVCNFKAQKNPMDLARTAAEVLSSDPTIHFVITGEGELLEDVKTWITSKSLQERVHLVGWRTDARALVAASNAFLLTSLWEGLPRALVEAMAERKPVVAYGVDGVNDILASGQNGYLIPPGDTHLAAEKLLWLKQHPSDAIRMGEAGRRQVETGFDIDTMVHQQETLYQSLYDSYPLRVHYEPVWNAHAPD